MFDIKAVKEEARKELAEELGKKAKEALKRKLRDRANAQQIVVNIDREIDDLEASIEDGSFAA